MEIWLRFYLDLVTSLCLVTGRLAGFACVLVLPGFRAFRSERLARRSLEDIAFPGRSHGNESFVRGGSHGNDAVEKLRQAERGGPEK